jgi:prepilin-type N-terminal cleavage/methylation domain-containing protein
MWKIVFSPHRIIPSTSWFTLVELMIVLAIIGMLAAALFPALNKYLGRGRDTTRYTWAMQIQAAINLYNIDFLIYPSFSWALLGPELETHECSDANPTGRTWTSTMWPIVKQYTWETPRDPKWVWPLCYHYIAGPYIHCPNSISYSLIYATEASRAPVGDLYAFQGEWGTYGRYCLTKK